MRDDSAKLVIALSRTYQALFRQIDQNIKGFGLTTNEFGVLEALLHKGALPVQKLTETLLITSGSMTYILQKLEKAEFIRRQQGTEDARVWMVALTEQGREFIERIYPLHQEFLEKLLAPVENHDTLIKELIQMKKVLERRKKV